MGSEDEGDETLVDGFRNIFLRGRYADTITVTAAVLIFIFVLGGLAVVFPPGALMAAAAMIISVRYVWLYDGARWGWARMNAAERAGAVAAGGVLVSAAAGVAVGASPYSAAFLVMVPLTVAVALRIRVWARPEQRISLEDFMIAAWTQGAVVGAGLIGLALIASGASWTATIISAPMSAAALLSLGYLALCLVVSLVLAVARNLYGGHGLRLAAGALVALDLWALFRFGL